MGRSARAHARIKHRQPLAAAVIVADGRERDALQSLTDLIADELNVKELRFVTDSEQLGSYEVKANYRTLGPRFGSRMPQVAAAVAALDASAVADALRRGATVAVHIDGSDHELTADDLQLVMQPLEGYQVERAGSHAVALDLHLTDELREEGLARDVVHSIQAARKEAGLDVSDRVALTITADPATVAAVRAHESYVAGETLATSVLLEEGDRLSISVEKR
jgi:isoleucyl-tRNA synthetase